MMITKVDIQKFGLFSDYDWNVVIGKSTMFRRLNIIYGRNYSGKTTLSRIFKCAEDTYLHEHYSGAAFRMTLESGKVIDQSTCDQLDEKWKIRVYNTDFVKENLSWIHNDREGTIEPFTILGAVNVDLDKQIKEIDSILGNLDEKRGLLVDLKELETASSRATAELRKNETEIDEVLKRKANDEIKINQNYFLSSVAKKTYSINDIKAEIAIVESDTKSFILSKDSKVKLIAQLREARMPDIVPMAETRPSFSSYLEDTRNILRKKIAPSKPIVELISDSLLQEWVRQGIEKHKEKRTSCAFCGNPINDDLWNKLDAHFSKESEDLRKEIHFKIQELESAKERLHSFLKVDRKQFYNTFQADFDSLLETWKAQIHSYSSNIDKLLSELRKREKDIFIEQEMPMVEDMSDKLYDTIRAFNSLVEAHQKKTKTLGDDHDKIRRCLRLNEIADLATSIDYKVKLEAISRQRSAVESGNCELKIVKADVERLLEMRETLEAQAKDEGRGAELVNTHLTHFFGHSELKLKAVGQSPAMKFIIERDGMQANNLSEGECSLISFCYFIARIEDEMRNNLDESKLIIYIDDPISSLDSNHIFFMFSLIENVIAKPGCFSQLFISTHNLDFLKYLKRLTTPKWKPTGSSDWKADVAYFVIERTNKSISKLKIAPNYLKNYITEFNYLFKQVYHCSIAENEDIERDYQYSFGNNMRKFLESYLFYKYPSHRLNNDQRIHKFFANDQVAFSLVSRVINEYSHLENRFDRSLEPVDVDSMKRIAVYVVERIKSVDPDQYDALVDSIQ